MLLRHIYNRGFSFVATDITKRERQFWVAVPEKTSRQLFAVILSKK